MHDIRFVHAKRWGDSVMTKKVWLAATTALIAGLVAVGAASGQIYEQKYVVEAIITPLDAEQPTITASEVWETVAYRDSTRFHTVVRVFGEALHFEFGGLDYFLLKRGANNSSAGAFDPMRECLGIDSLAEYSDAGPLQTCEVRGWPPMLVRIGEGGSIERLERQSASEPYPEFTIEFRVSPTTSSPSYSLLSRFPWIAELPQHEPSSLPVKIPEEGRFSMSKHYRKDFALRE